MEFAGPLWVGKIFDKQFCMKMEQQAEHMAFNQRERIGKLLASMINEADAPATYYVIDNICDRLALPVPSVKSILEALKKEGFQACLTHFNPTGIRTDAPASSMCELLREVVGSCPSKS
jgi:tRNA (guanine26-N2/guanine27-N2)-dimethyltransferase